MMENQWQYNVLKVTAAACLDNYRSTHNAFYLVRAIECTTKALMLLRSERCAH